MRCSKCYKVCTAISGEGLNAFSNCCQADIMYPENDQMQSFSHHNFPTSVSPEWAGLIKKEEISLRDYFAAKAMQGIMSTVYHPRCPSFEEIAVMSYKEADFMLIESIKCK